MISRQAMKRRGGGVKKSEENEIMARGYCSNIENISNQCQRLNLKETADIEKQWWRQPAINQWRRKEENVLNMKPAMKAKMKKTGKMK